MYTQFDKAIVAVVMAAVGLSNIFGFHWGLTEPAVTALVVSLTPVLVWIVPNLPKDV